MNLVVTAVFDAPWFEDPAPWPWPISDARPYSRIRVSGSMTLPEVGSAIAALADHNHVDEDPPGDWFEPILLADELSLPGGLVLAANGCTVTPGCCSGLEEWTKWRNCLDSSSSPWMGHDPAPWIEYIGDDIRIWSDGGLGTEGNSRGCYASTTRVELTRAIDRVETDLFGFLDKSSQWLRMHPSSTGNAVLLRIAEMLGLELEALDS